MPSEPTSPVNDALGDPTLRSSLVEFVRRRVPPSDVEDVVQTVLLDALAAPNPPREPGALKPWLIGVARHEIADWHRRARREPSAEPGDIPEAPPPLEAPASCVRGAPASTASIRRAPMTPRAMRIPP